MPSKAKVGVVAALGTVGIVSVIMGAIAPTLVQNMIKVGITDLRIISDSGSYEKCSKSERYYGGVMPSSIDSSSCATSDGSYDYYFYNITNAKAIIESGDKPLLHEIHVSTDYVSKEFDIEFSKVDGNHIVSYQTWSYYTPTAEFEEMLNRSITQINPVYFSGVAVLGGSEKKTMMGLSYIVVDSLQSLYNNSLRAVAAGLCRANVAYTYDPVNYAAYAYTGGYCAYCDPTDYTTVAGENACTGDKDSSVALFGNYSVMQDLIEKNNYDNAYASGRGLGVDSILYSDYIYNALAQGDQKSADSIVVAPEISNYLRTGNTGCSTYGPFNQYYWNNFWTPDSPYVDTSNNMQTGCDFQMTSAQTKAFFEAFSDEAFNKQFLSAVYAWYIASQGTTGTSSSPSSTGIPSSYRTYYYLTDISGYGMSLYEVLADSRCVNAGINYGNAFGVFQYLAVYATEQFMIRGFIVGYDRDRTTGTLSLQPDGTGNKNSGLFTTRSMHEFLFGYTDVLSDYLPEMTYSGISGKQYKTIAEQVAAKPSQPESKFTGKDATDKYDHWYSNSNGSTTQQKRGDLGYQWSNLESEWTAYTCAEEPWLASNYGSDDCYIWDICEDGTDDCTDTFEIELKGSSKGKSFEPFFKMGDDVEVFVPTFQRKLLFTARNGDLPDFMGEMPRATVLPEDYGGYDIHGIKTIRYYMDESNFENSTENEVYFMGPKHDDCEVCAYSWMMPMDRINFYPIVYSKPYLCDTSIHSVQNRVEVTRSPDTEDKTCSDVSPYLAVEPLTGMTLKQNVMFQVNWQLSDLLLDGTLYSSVTSAVSVLPFFWVDKADSIAADDAATFREKLYDPVYTANRVLWSVVPIGSIMIVAAIFFAFTWENIFGGVDVKPPRVIDNENTHNPLGL